MAQRLLLEGSDIDELLARVRTEHGPRARIVHAEQKLVGGLGGFFARRRYEVAIAIDDDPAPVNDLVTASPPTTLEELLAVADAQDGAPAKLTSTNSAPTNSAPVNSAPVNSAPTAVPEPSHQPATRIPGRSLSTESASFDHLVRDLVARAAPETRTSTTDFAASVAPTVTPSDAARIIDLDKPLHAASATPVSPPTTPPTQPCVDRPTPPPTGQPVPQLLLNLGLPVAGVQSQVPKDHRTSLLDALAEIAVDVPTRAHGVQVVVGPTGASQQVIDAWLLLSGANSTAVLDLSDAAEPATQDNPREFAERLERLESQRGGVLVVVPAGDTRSQARTAGRRIADFRTNAVTAVVDARWDGAVVRAWLAALAEGGGPATHLAAHGINESPTPLRLLEHGLPVTWLDARPATLGVWAGPCLDRLDDDATSADQG